MKYTVAIKTEWGEIKTDYPLAFEKCIHYFSSTVFMLSLGYHEHSLEEIAR